MAALLTMGASGVVLGTRFLFTHECSYSQEKKDAIIQAGLINSTRRTLAFDEVGRTMGWPDKCDGRALTNSIVKDLDEGLDLETRLKRFDDSAASGDKSRLVVWAGEGVGLTDHISSASVSVKFGSFLL
jgi:nitronate monooxygenase